MKKKNFNFQNISEKVLAVILCIFLLLLLIPSTSTQLITLTYSEFKQEVKDGNVSEVEISSNKLTGTLKKPKAYPEKFKDLDIKPSSEEDLEFSQIEAYYIKDDSLLQLMEDKGVKYSVIPTSTSSKVLSVAMSFLPLILLIGLFAMASKQMKGTGLSNVESFDATNSKVKFDDVAGQDEAKESLKEVVDILKNPAKYNEIGAKIPKGILLVGPPGTGKTLLAKAVAGEAGVKFLSVSASSFVELFVGNGAAKIRKLFKEAKSHSKAIIFIDEIDAVGESRNGVNQSPERDQTLTELLTQMNGFNEEKTIIVMAATNRPEVLDKALTRPGRFDRQIVVGNPDAKGRVDILKLHSSKVKIAEDVDFEEVAKATVGASGSDLANIINESALQAVRNGHKIVEKADVDTAVETVIAGAVKKNQILTEKDKNIVSYHEIGHALVAGLLNGTDPVQKISIVPRTNGALGFTLQVPEDDKLLQTKTDMINQIMILLGGRAAEDVKFGDISTGASNDLQRANNIARSMISVYGMSDESLNMMLEMPTGSYIGSTKTRICSEQTYANVDRQVKAVLDNAYKSCKDMLVNNSLLLDELAKRLLEQESITGQEFSDILKAHGIDLKSKSSSI